MSILRGSRSRLCLLSANVPVAAAHAIEHNRFTAPAGRPRFRPEIKLYRLPSIATLRLQAGTRSWLVTAVHHAILPAAIAWIASYHAVSVALSFPGTPCVA